MAKLDLIMKNTFLLSTIGIFFSASIFANPTLPAQAQDRINQRLDDQRIEDKIPSHPYNSNNPLHNHLRRKENMARCLLQKKNWRNSLN